MLVSALPELSSHALTPADSFVILGSDGVWDVISDEVAVSLVQGCMQAPDAAAKQGSAGGGMGVILAGKQAADAVINAALRAGSHDNITAAVMIFNWK